MNKINVLQAVFIFEPETLPLFMAFVCETEIIIFAASVLS